MGPNLYCTPPESFTQMHQDGHGTVDSGHLCLSGYNEVVIFRRLTERHKMNALALLKGQGSELKYDGLGDLPHGDNLVRRVILRRPSDCKAVISSRFPWLALGRKA